MIYMRLFAITVALGITLLLPFEANAVTSPAEDDVVVSARGRHVYVGGGVPILFKTNHAGRRVARMDRPEDRIDPWSPKLEPLPPFASQLPPTKIDDDTDPWNGEKLVIAHQRLALDTTDPW